MNPTPRCPHPVAVAAVALLLSGCISLLPKQPPVQLYRFGVPPPPPPAGSAPAAAQFSVRAAATGFERAAAGDRILTVVGNQAAYIAKARWVTPAGTLFDAAVARAFESHLGPARLLATGEPIAADYTLKLDTRAFEARYDHGPGAAPLIVIEVYAALDPRVGPTADTRRLFHAESRATSNNIRSICAAFDTAVTQALTDLVGWVDSAGAPAKG